jgi:hypothetical protein
VAHLVRILGRQRRHRLASGGHTALHRPARDDDQQAEHHFAAAVEAHGEAARPFERARTELAFGEFLRRTRQRVDAREHLHTALDGFETLGATRGPNGHASSCAPAARPPAGAIPAPASN